MTSLHARFHPARLFRALLCLGFAAAGAASLHAQVQYDDDDRPEPITLSPFEVSTEQDVGYLAGNTLAGSRFNTRLKDTPASISVFTEEFLEDLSAFRLEEALQYAVNVEFWDDDERSSVIGNGVFSSYQDYRVRGLSTSRARNYFPTGRIPTESAIIQRIEDSRGPNAVVFGIGSPGGIINVNTKRAMFGRDFQKVTLSVGSFDEYRAALDWNQPLIPGKLSARLNLVYNDHQSFRHWEFEEHARAHLALGYRLTDRTTFRLELERGRVFSNRAVSFNLLDSGVVNFIHAGRPTFSQRTGPEGGATTVDFIRSQPNRPFVTYYSNNNTVYNEQRNPISGMRTQEPFDDRVPISDRSIVDFSVNHGGPGQNRESYFSVLSAYMEHQFSENTFMEVAYNHREHKWDFRDPRGARRQFFGDPNALRADGTPNPFAGRLYLEAQWFRGHRFDQGDTGRAMISHDMDFGKWGSYRVGAYGEYDKSFIGNGTLEEMWVDAETGEPAFHPNPNNARNDVRRRTYVTEGVWETYSVDGPVGDTGLLENMFDPITGRTLSSTWMRNNIREVYSSLKTGMIVAQGRWFNDRLIAGGGLRRDEFAETTVGRRRNPVTGIRELERDPALAERASENSAIGRTKTFGLVYHLTPQISLYYNVSDNISVPNPGHSMLHPSGDPLLSPIPVPKPVGEGEDYGFGLSLFDDRIYIRGTYYVTRGKNQSITSPSAARRANDRIMDTLLLEGATVDEETGEVLTPGLITQAEHDARTDLGSQGLFGHETTGVELQVTGNPTPNWRITASYSYSDPIEDFRFTPWPLWEEIARQFVTDLGAMDLETTDGGRTVREEFDNFIRPAIENNRVAIGQGKLGTRHHKFNLFTRYTFSSGMLKGLYIGGGFRHQTKMWVGVDDDGNNLYGNPMESTDALAGYTIRNLPVVGTMKLQLNVRNVFDDRTPLILRYSSDNQPDEPSVLRERIVAPRTYRLTATFEF